MTTNSKTITFTKQELEFLQQAIRVAGKVQVSQGGPRDYYWEDLYDSVQEKLKEEN